MPDAGPDIYFGARGGNLSLHERFRLYDIFFQKISATFSIPARNVPMHISPEHSFHFVQSVLGAGIEPARPCGHKILSLAWLPITPPEHAGNHSINRDIFDFKRRKLACI